MDKGIIVRTIATIIGSFLTYKAAMTKSRHDYQAKIEQMKMEAEAKLKESTATTESIYIGEMKHIINAYKEQVEDLKRENQEIRQQISKLKDEQKEIIEKLTKERTYYERELELKDEIIEGLQEENEDLKNKLFVKKEDEIND